MFRKPRSRTQEDRDSKRIPEPGESGPLERETAFLEQRLSRLRRRLAPSDEAGGPSPPAEEDQTGPLPPNLRQNLMAEYRRRQRAQRASPDPESPEKPSPSLPPSTPAGEEDVCNP
jgi:hypothetical protein